LAAQDEQLKMGLRKGDIEVFKQLFLEYSPGLIRYGSSLTGDREAAKELVQDLFMEIWEKRESILIQGTLKPYLFSSVYHKSLNWLRSKKIKELYFNNPVEISSWFSSQDNPDTKDPLMLIIIEKQIQILPHQCREVFTRSVIFGETTKEIAGKLGLTAKTIENHLSRAKKILRKKLKKFH